MLRQIIHDMSVKTNGKSLNSITRLIQSWLEKQTVKTGLLTVFLKHTSASLIIQENADSNVLRDLSDFFDRIVGEDYPYRHDAEGPDDMPAHIRAALTQTHLSIPIQRGQLGLGTWQGIYVFEHRDQPQCRVVTLHLIGE